MSCSEHARRRFDPPLVGNARDKRAAVTTETALLARPLPAINDMNGYFWCGGADGVLHIMKCGDCSLYFHPYQSCCRACLSANVAPAPVSGPGPVLSSTIKPPTWFRSDARYVGQECVRTVIVRWS